VSLTFVQVANHQNQTNTCRLQNLYGIEKGNEKYHCKKVLKFILKSVLKHTLKSYVRPAEQ